MTMISRQRLTAFEPSGIKVGAGLAVGALTALALLPVAFRGWIPHDEGTLAQAATRILDGQMPHIDFLDVYPGLQGFIHAGFMAVLGESIASMRIAWLVVAAIAGLVSFHLVVRELGLAWATISGFAFTLAGFVFYPSSMPTWWNLAAALAVAWLLQASQRPRSRDGRRYVLLAGLITGASILIKSTGGAIVAIPAFLWLLSRSPRRSDMSLAVCSILGATAVMAVVVPGAPLSRFILIGGPALAGLVLIWLHRTEVKPALVPSMLDKPHVIYSLGVVALPLLAISAFAMMGEAEALLSGWVESPALRFGSASRNAPLSLGGLVVLGGSVIAAWLARRAIGEQKTLVVMSFLVIVSLYTGFSQTVGSFFLAILWMGFGISMYAIATHQYRAYSPDAILVVALATSFLVVQVPLWNGIYGAYTIPLLLLALVKLMPHVGKTVAVVAALAFVIVAAHSASGRLVGVTALEESVPFVALEPERGGISIPVFHDYYNDMTAHIADLGVTDLYAGPDSPEVSFLADVPSLYEGFFEVLDPDWSYTMPARWVGSGSAVVVNNDPNFSAPIPHPEVDRIHSAFSHMSSFGPFDVYWSESQ